MQAIIKIVEKISTQKQIILILGIQLIIFILTILYKTKLLNILKNIKFDTFYLLFTRILNNNIDRNKGQQGIVKHEQIVKVCQNPLKDHRNGHRNFMYISSDITIVQELFMISISLRRGGYKIITKFNYFYSCLFAAYNAMKLFHDYAEHTLPVTGTCIYEIPLGLSRTELTRLS